MAKIPEIKKNQIEVAKAGSETLALVWNMLFPMFPIGKIIPHSIQWIINKKLEQALEILITELKKGNIHYLTDEKYEALVPAGLRIYKAAIEGEARHNLFILARLLRGYLENDAVEFADYSNAVEALRGLSVRQLAILKEFSKISFQNITYGRQSGVGELEKVMRLNEQVEIKLLADDYIKLDYYFDVKALIVKGFFYEAGQDMNILQIIYRPSKFITTPIFYKILSLAGSLDLDDLTPNPSPSEKEKAHFPSPQGEG